MIFATLTDTANHLIGFISDNPVQVALAYAFGAIFASVAYFAIRTR